MIKVESSYIHSLVQKWFKNYKTGIAPDWTDEEKNKFYAETPEGKFTACDNTSGQCWVEDFNKFEAVEAYLEKDCDIDECNKIDGRCS